MNYSGQTERLDQMEEVMEYIETANQYGVQLDPAVLSAMFANTNGNGNGNFSFISEKDIKSKVFEPHRSVFEDYFSTLVQASKSLDAAEDGIAGVMYSEDGSSSRLFTANGYEYAELIEKGLMGALCYYQATALYLSDEKMEVDNEEIVEDEGTAMAHHWDEAYGYLGVGNNFPENTEDIRYWGKYCNLRNAVLGSNEKLSEAFRIGRSGIMWQRYNERDSAITLVRTEWENVCAATAIHYINSALANMDSDYLRNHVLSEAHGLVKALFYNPERRITQSQIDEVIVLLGDNFYAVSTSDLQQARDMLAGVYGWENIKTTL
ncbi:MAG: DUF4856 domain-containing protein [Flavobacteriales bacterium]|nr:DUF4856 domain-containing protein [Flavobacteriales bacterium]